DHLRQMSNNLLLFSRDPAQEGVDGRTEMGRWVRGVKALVERSLGLGGSGLPVRMIWDVPDDLPNVRIAPHRLTQVVLNLAYNSRDAVLAKAGAAARGYSAGCITVRARADESGEGQGGRVALEVIDDGCGMNEEVKRRCTE